jgi:hypothetical protein
MSDLFASRHLIDAFDDAATFLLARMKHGGWKTFSANYLREHVRCKTGLKFSNSISPMILRGLLERRPELAEFIELGTLKSE